jgi:hypothetical protein
MPPFELLTPTDVVDVSEPDIGPGTHEHATTRTHTVRSDSASRHAADVAALVDRLRLLRAVLAGMADDLAQARREIRQLRRENARLKERLTRDPAASTRKGR